MASALVEVLKGDTWDPGSWWKEVAFRLLWQHKSSVTSKTGVICSATWGPSNFTIV